MSMADTDADIFMTQGQEEQDGVDLFTNLATAVTVRQCKLVQKKAKLKQLVSKLQDIDRDLASWKEKVLAMENEQREIAQQEKLCIMNINGLKQSRAAQQSVIADLDSKISSLKLEILEKRAKYKAIVQDADETWERYKKQYEEFPLAKKRQELRTKIRLIDIEIKKTKFTISDIKYLTKKKREIADKRRNAMCINLAQMYVDAKKKMAENSIMQNKIREMKQELADIKAGKYSTAKLNTTDSPTSSSLQSTQFHSILNHDQKKLSPPKASMWELPQIQKPQSPPLSFRSCGGFDWTSLLQSSSLVNFTSTLQLMGGGEQRKAANAEGSGQQQQGANVSKKMRIQPGNVNSRALIAAHDKAAAKEKRTAITSSGPNNIVAPIPMAVIPSEPADIPKKKSELACDEPKTTNATAKALEHEAPMGQKREYDPSSVVLNDASNDLGESGNKKLKGLALDFNSHLITAGQKMETEQANAKLNDAKELGERDNNEKQKCSTLGYGSHEINNFNDVAKTYEPADNKTDVSDARTITKGRVAETSLNSIKKYMESLAIKNKEQQLVLQRDIAAAKNKLNPQAVGKQVVHYQRMNVEEIEKRQLPENIGANPLVSSQRLAGQRKILSENVNSYGEASQNENCLIAMDPSPPPDLVPIENNGSQSQPHSQSSQEMPDEYYSSPVELDAAAKRHYARLEAESPPPIVYPSGQQLQFNDPADLTSAQMQGMAATGGQSKYFSNKPTSPPANEEQDTCNSNDDSYHLMPAFSPPGGYGGGVGVVSPLPGNSSLGLSPPDGRFPMGNELEESNKEPSKQNSLFGKKPENESNKKNFRGSFFGEKSKGKSFFSMF